MQVYPDNITVARDREEIHLIYRSMHFQKLKAGICYLNPCFAGVCDTISEKDICLNSRRKMCVFEEMCGKHT